MMTGYIGFLLGVSAAIIAAMFATLRGGKGTELVPTDVPSWINTMAKWGAPKRPIPIKPTPIVYTYIRKPRLVFVTHVPWWQYFYAYVILGVWDARPWRPFSLHNSPEWWDEQVTPTHAEPVYTGNHRRDILEQDPEWRARWASYNTQDWPYTPVGPTTPGDLLDLRPDICIGEMSPKALPVVRSVKWVEDEIFEPV